MRHCFGTCAHAGCRLCKVARMRSGMHRRAMRSVQRGPLLPRALEQRLHAKVELDVAPVQHREIEQRRRLKVLARRDVRHPVERVGEQEGGDAKRTGNGGQAVPGQEVFVHQQEQIETLASPQSRKQLRRAGEQHGGIAPLLELAAQLQSLEFFAVDKGHDSRSAHFDHSVISQGALTGKSWQGMTGLKVIFQLSIESWISELLAKPDF